MGRFRKLAPVGETFLGRINEPKTGSGSIVSFVAAARRIPRAVTRVSNGSWSRCRRGGSLLVITTLHEQVGSPPPHLRWILGALRAPLYPDIGPFQALYPKPT